LVVDLGGADMISTQELAKHQGQADVAIEFIKYDSGDAEQMKAMRSLLL
jgi:hypothetical protein